MARIYFKIMIKLISHKSLKIKFINAPLIDVLKLCRLQNNTVSEIGKQPRQIIFIIIYYIYSPPHHITHSNL